MARAELKINLNALRNLENRFKSPALEAKLRGVPAMKEVAALVAQAIADNFAQEGPGWEPLKGATIRNSVAMNKATKALIKDAYFSAAFKIGAVKVSKAGKRSIDREALRGNKKKFYEEADKFIERVEKSSRSTAEDGDALGNRQILRRTSLLYQTVTTPGFSGSGPRTKYGGSVSGANIYRVQGSNLIWGTNLIYAATHNEGRGAIPQREFLVIRDQWQKRLTLFVFKLMSDIVKNHVEGK